MKTLEIINYGSNFLKEKKISSYIFDSELLLSKVLKKSREEILINLDRKIDKKNISIYKKYLKRRSKNEPMAYIFKEKEFWDKKFIVNEHTLIPRPETELLVEMILKMNKKKRLSILDIGTGSGCIIISLLDSLKNSYGVGIDTSKNAILVAKKNVFKFKLSNRVKLINKSFERIFGEKFDLIVSNPLTLRENIKNLSDDIKKYEPRMALDGGNDGFDY